MPVPQYYDKEGTSWKQVGSGTAWIPLNTKAKQVSSAANTPALTHDDVTAQVHRYITGGDDKTTTTESDGSLTVYQLLKRHGVKDTDSITWHGKKYNSLAFWTAVVRAESGGNVKDVSPPNTNGTIDRGLFQVNSVHSQYDPTKLVNDADYNTIAAKAISGNWTNPQPWASAKNDLLNVTGDMKVTGSGNDTGPGKPTTLLNQLGQTASDTTATLAGFATILFDPSTWFRAGKVLLGGILILIVVAMAIRSAL